MSAIDPYTYCPGGTGKKIKFCCNDLVGDLGRIQEMLDGGQRAACLEHIETLEKKFPGRACLVTTRALLESALGSNEKAGATIEQFLEKNPNNPVALAEHALISAARHGPLAGIQPLQKALEQSTEVISGRVAGAIGRIGEMLLRKGDVAAARGHFILAYRLNPEDQDSLQFLARILGSPGLPMVLKNEQMLADAPAGASWKGDCDAAIRDAARGLWWRAADKLRDLSQKVPDSREVWQNLAVLRSWLGDRPGTVAALHKFASLADGDDAVEAEALAQIFDAAEDGDVVDELRAVAVVRDFDRAVESLAASKQAAAFDWESLGVDFGDQPRPRGAFYLVDRPIPETTEIRRDEIPNIVGKLLTFGRQTDREARVELYCRRPELDVAKNLLSTILGDSADALGEPEKIDDVPKAEAALSWSWRMPEGVPAAKIEKLVEEQRRASLLETWANTPFTRFGGKSPLEAAADPQYRLAVSAAVSLLELSFPQASSGPLFEELRSKLGLPQPQTPDPEKAGPTGVPYSRLHRIDAAKLADEDLVMYLNRALQVVARQAVRKLGQEAVSRESLKGKVDVAAVYGHLADLEGTSDEALAYIDLARKSAEEQKQSSATWDLEELELRLRRGEGNDFMRLVAHIEQQHIREPGVSQALMEILYSAGLIGPDGKLRMPAMSADSASAASPAPAASKLWTPDAPTPAAPAGASTKSGLWVPD